jgi:hypothetical protein
MGHPYFEQFKIREMMAWQMTKQQDGMAVGIPYHASGYCPGCGCSTHTCRCTSKSFGPYDLALLPYLLDLHMRVSSDSHMSRPEQTDQQGASSAVQSTRGENTHLSVCTPKAFLPNSSLHIKHCAGCGVRVSLVHMKHYFSQLLAEPYIVSYGVAGSYNSFFLAGVMLSPTWVTDVTSCVTNDTVCQQWNDITPCTDAGWEGVGGSGTSALCGATLGGGGGGCGGGGCGGGC